MERRKTQLKNHCLFCSKRCSEPTPLLQDDIVVLGAVGCAKLQRQLQQVFILRKLLDVPGDWCVKTLETFGGNQDNSNPDSWFQICGGCIKMVERAWNIYQQLLEIRSQFNLIKSQIKKVMLEGLSGSQCKRMNWGGLEGEIRGLLFPDLVPYEEMGSNSEPELEGNDCGMDLEEAVSSSPSDSEPEGNSIHDTFSTVGNWKRKRGRPPKGTVGNYDKSKFYMSKGGHLKKRTFYWKMCQLCPSRFKEQKDYDAHMEAHTWSDENGGNFSCNVCKYPAKSDLELNQHIGDRHHEATKRYPCKICDFASKTWKQLKVHVEEEHPGVPKGELGKDLQLECQVCGKSFEDRRALVVHQKKVHPELFGAAGTKVLSCDQCNLKFADQIQLKYHVDRTHKRVDKFVCDICGKGFEYVGRLERHKVSHQKGGQREFVCHICGCDYSYKSILEKHYKDIHPEGNFSASQSEDKQGNGSEVFKCKQCDLTSPFKVVILRHQETHKKELGHQCEICLKYYSSVNSLSRHKRINHSEGGQQFNCPYCNKPFPAEDYLKTHITKYCKLKGLVEYQVVGGESVPQDQE